MNKKRAILVVDVLIGIFQLPVEVFRKDSFLANMGKLLEKARNSEVPIIYVRHCGPKGTPFEKGQPGWEFHPGITPKNNDIIVEKTNPDSFQETNLEKILKESEIEELIICGFASEACVDTTVRSAYSKGYSVILISDCHTTTDSEVLGAQQIVDHHNNVLCKFAKVQSLDKTDLKSL
ncbi:MAG: cysteine hydrolase [Deltaproteobacteria bacterium]|nr:cysteine hydrolase [Deltaproteobacteria bacterium]